jgi:hypothetical protein
MQKFKSLVLVLVVVFVCLGPGAFSVFGQWYDDYYYDDYYTGYYDPYYGWYDPGHYYEPRYYEEWYAFDDSFFYPPPGQTIVYDGYPGLIGCNL